MKLSDQLREIKAQFVASADPEVLATMQQATASLEALQLADRALKVGARAPQFTLNDERGVSFALSDFLTRGPLLLHFFRGHW